MPVLAIKSGTTAIEGSTVKGSFSYFSGSTKDLGPTNVTGFYSGVDAPEGGYTLYQIGGSGGWTARVATGTTQLNSILISIGGTGTTVNQNITWATNTNSVYINSGATPTYSVGQQALGGTIAYILQSGDPGYDANVQHGFVSAINANPTSRQWGCYQTVEILGQAVGNGAIGDGSAATAQINAQCSERPIAASVAIATNAGYDDWYLPSKDELNKLYLNRVAIGYNTSARYWSSTQNNSSLGRAWAQTFSIGIQSSENKNLPSRVIPIRSF
jgi:hypothetical protein